MDYNESDFVFMQTDQTGRMLPFTIIFSSPQTAQLLLIPFMSNSNRKKQKIPLKSQKNAKIDFAFVFLAKFKLYGSTKILPIRPKMIDKA